MKGIVLLAQYFNKQATLSAQQLAADAHYDERIDIKDLVSLQQLLVQSSAAALQDVSVQSSPGILTVPLTAAITSASIAKQSSGEYLTMKISVLLKSDSI